MSRLGGSDLEVIISEVGYGGVIFYQGGHRKAVKCYQGPPEKANQGLLGAFFVYFTVLKINSGAIGNVDRRPEQAGI